jgi:hypothetical protein
MMLFPHRKNDMSKFQKGHKGGPGRPPGSRNKAKNTLDEIGADCAPAALRAVARKARAGDVSAAKLVLARAWPIQRCRTIKIDLPPTVDAAGVAAAQQAVIAAVAQGQLTPDEGNALASLIENRRRALDTVLLEEQLAELERYQEERDRQHRTAPSPWR